MSSQVTSFSLLGESLAASCDKAFVVGPGHAPIPAKLVKKIIKGEFVELADLLSTNLRAVDLEPQAFLGGKLLVSKKCRLVEVEDILTWTEALTIYQMVICASHPHRWSDLTKYKLLIIQTARHLPGRSWLEYDIAFRKDAAATGASDWSRMNLDLYNFHLRSPAPPRLYHRPLACPYRPQLHVEGVPVPRTVPHGTEGNAFGLLVNAIFATHAAPVTETTHGSAAHSIPLAPFAPAPPPSPWEGSPERVSMPSVFPVHSVYNVPVAADQPSGLPCSMASFCSSSVVSPGTSVPVRSFSPLAPVHLVSPLQLSQFQLELADYPDQAAADYILNGLRDGFRIGFKALSVSLRSSSSNMRSALDHPSVIDAYLQNEVSCGRVAGPFSTPPFTDLHISCFGVVPKNNQPGKWRLILDLSSPDGHSVNDGIPKAPFSIQYVTVDAFINGIMARGHGTSLAKFDVASAYRNVAIHPLDRPLLGMKWREQYYVDMALPFGLRSAPYIFTAIADMVQWMLTSHHGVDFLRHYLDDFLTLGPPASSVCYNNLQACIQLCSKLGLPLHPDKLEGPSTCLSILGIELDSVRLQARLSIDKRDRIITLLESWSGKRFCTRRELESLIGHLHYACKIPPRAEHSSVA